MTERALERELLRPAGREKSAAGCESLQVDPEQVVAAEPEWVITSEGGQLSSFPGYNGTTALQEDQIVRVDPNLFNQRGPRYADVVENLAETFHAEALATARDNDSTDDSGDDSVSENGTEDSADGDGTGLTVVAVLVALSTLVVVGRRRADR